MAGAAPRALPKEKPPVLAAGALKRMKRRIKSSYSVPTLTKTKL